MSLQTALHRPFLWLSSIPLSKRTTASLSIPLLMDIDMASKSLLL